jgi:YD repeat-containing protein
MWTTANGIPGALQSSTATFSVWMNETAPVSGLYPSLNLEAYMNLAWAPPQYWSFSSLCSVQGSSSLTTTLTKYTFTCGPFTDQETFSSPFGVVVSVNWTAGHQITSNVQAQVYLEGSLNGNYDSTVTIPEIIQPFLYNLSPSQGPPGTLATLTGNAFGASQGTGAVSFNGIAAAPTSWSNTSIVVPVPTGATTGPIVVSADSQTSNALVFVVSPMITAISPATGVTGSSITINGSNFGNSRGTSTVIFNGIPGIPTSWSNAGITVLVPPGATSGPVEVVVGGVPSNAATFTCGPTLSSISPGAARPGAVVSIIGTNLGATQGSSILAFNGVPATPTSWSSTQIITAIPTSATSGPVTITISGIQSNGVYFAIGDGKISGVVSQTSNGSPIAGATVQVMQTRTNSGSTTTGSDGNYSVSNLATGTYDVIASATGLGTVISQGNAVTAGSTTTVNVSLSLPGTVSGQVTASSGGGSISGASVNVLEAGDLVASGSTDSSGNYSIGTIGSGTYNVQASASGYQPAFQSSVAVTAGNTATVNLALPSQKAITFTYDAIGRLIGAVDPQGNAVDYKYDAVGNIKSISEYPSTQTSIIGFTPASGPVGTAVTVSGSGFSATANQNSVTFNGFVATISSASATQLVVNVPNGATTGLISVTSPLGSANSSAVYTVTP